MPAISEFLAREIADAWEVMAASEKDATTSRRETLRECADLIRMMADRTEPLIKPEA